MEWCIEIGVAGRIIVIKIGPGRLLRYSASLRSLLREQYAETLISIIINGQWSHGGAGSIVTLCHPR